MRDCLARVVENGSDRKVAYKDAFLLAKEFKRMEYTQERAIGQLHQWAEKCSPPLKRSELTSAIRTLTKVYEKNDPPLSCAMDRYLVKHGYCFLKGEADRSCEFKNSVETIRRFQRGRKIVEAGWDGWEKYLGQNHKDIGQYAICFYIALKRIETERDLPQGEVIYAGFRQIQFSILSRFRDIKPPLSSLCACSRLLESLHLIRVIRAKPTQARSNGHRQANGYTRVLPIPPAPAVPTTPIL